MESSRQTTAISLVLDEEESLVLHDLLQRLVEENEQKLLPLLESSAEFAVLCRLNSHLEKQLPEALEDDYEAKLTRARKRIIGKTGRYEGIE